MARRRWPRCSTNIERCWCVSASGWIELIAAIDAATDAEADDVNEHMLRRLATTHRDSIGVMGRLSAPLSAPVAAMYADLFDEWQLPVPALFGQMLLPPAATTLMTELSASPGRHVLFDRLRKLADNIVDLGENTSAAAELARAWIDEQVADPLPDDVVKALRGVQPLFAERPGNGAGISRLGALHQSGGAGVHRRDRHPDRPPRNGGSDCHRAARC